MFAFFDIWFYVSSVCFQGRLYSFRGMLIMPKKCVVLVAILLGIGVLFGHAELEKRYEDWKFTQSIIKKFSPTNRIQSFFVVFCYVFLSSVPSLLFFVF